MTAWMVRAGTKGVLFEEFIENSVATIGWTDIGELKPTDDLDSLRERVRQQWPDWHAQKITMSASQLARFRNSIRKGDLVVTYDPSRRVYRLGKALGTYTFDPRHPHKDGGNSIGVEWGTEVGRDDLRARTKNSLGAISTLFRIPPHAEADLLRAAAGQPTVDDASDDGDDEELEYTLDAIQSRAGELISDRLVRLSWEDMQELVAGLLRGMGYKTEVSPRGSDRGKDIIASPDGFGFQDPRIVVEVKHREKTAIGAGDIRAFLGGRQDGDRCLYVSTGGFTKDARYEAERSRYPLKLMTLDDLSVAILSGYEQLDTETKALVPLSRIYWPAD